MSRDVLSVDSNTLDSTISVLNRASVFLDDSVSHSKNSFSYLQSSPTLAHLPLVKESIHYITIWALWLKD